MFSYREYLAELVAVYTLLTFKKTSDQRFCKVIYKFFKLKILVSEGYFYTFKFEFTNINWKVIKENKLENKKIVMLSYSHYIVL